MKRLSVWVGLLTLLGLIATGIAWADPPTAHQVIQQYDGPQTCATCHPGKPAEVARSAHYQQSAAAGPNVPGMQGQKVGMLEGY